MVCVSRHFVSVMHVCKDTGRAQVSLDVYVLYLSICIDFTYALKSVQLTKEENQTMYVSDFMAQQLLIVMGVSFEYLIGEIGRL